LTTPSLGTPTAIVLTNATGTAANLTAGNATNLTSLTTTVTKLNYLTSASGTTGTTSDKLVFAASPTLTGSVTMPGTGIWNSSGNVGIGTVSPGSYKLNVTGTLYASGSSREYKENIIPLALDPSKIYELNPVTFDYKPQYKDFGKCFQVAVNSV